MISNYALRNLLMFVCLFDLILYVPVNIFSVMLGWVFLGWTSSKLASASGEAQTHNLESSTLPLSHHAPLNKYVVCLKSPLFLTQSYWKI